MEFHVGSSSITGEIPIIVFQTVEHMLNFMPLSSPVGFNRITQACKCMQDWGLKSETFKKNATHLSLFTLITDLAFLSARQWKKSILCLFIIGCGFRFSAIKFGLQTKYSLTGIYPNGTNRNKIEQLLLVCLFIKKKKKKACLHFESNTS